MKHIKTAAALLLAALLALSICGCKAEDNTQTEPDTAIPETTEPQTEEPSAAEPETETTEPEDTSIHVTDMLGRAIDMDAPAKSVVALTASDCEILYALGAGDMLIGRGEYCDYPAEVMDITAVQSGSETNIEQIIALAPDVLLMNKMDQPKEQTAQLEEAGITVVISDANSIEETYVSIALIGAVTGKDAEAAALIDGMKASFAEIGELAAGDGTETVYFEVSPLEYGLWTAGSGSFMNEVADMLGLTNIFADVENWAAVSEEQVIERDPDYIVTISMYYGEGPTPVEEIMARPGWENVTAVKNGAILNLTGNELSRPGPRLADGARLLYEFVYVTMAADKAA